MPALSIADRMDLKIDEGDNKSRSPFPLSCSSSVNVYQVKDSMYERGWNLSPLQKPAAVHLCVTHANFHRADEFIADLQASVDEVKAFPGE